MYKEGFCMAISCIPHVQDVFPILIPKCEDPKSANESFCSSRLVSIRLEMGKDIEPGGR